MGRGEWREGRGERREKREEKRREEKRKEKRRKEKRRGHDAVVKRHQTTKQARGQNELQNERDQQIGLNSHK